MTPRPTNLNKATADALQLLTDASNKQLQLIADAALNATKLLAVQAAEAEKVRSTKGADDHDSLTTLIGSVSTLNDRLTEKFDELKLDIKDLKDGISSRVTILENEKLNIRYSYPVLYKVAVEKTLDDYESRIRINTGKITQIMTWGSAGVVALGILEFILNKLL